MATLMPRQLRALGRKDFKKGEVQYVSQTIADLTCDNDEYPAEAR